MALSLVLDFSRGTSVRKNRSILFRFSRKILTSYHEFTSLRGEFTRKKVVGIFDPIVRILPSITADTSSSSINRPRQQIPAPFSPKIPVNSNRELYRTNFSESYAQNTNHYLTQRQFLRTTLRPASFPRLDRHRSTTIRSPPSSLAFL